MINFTCDRAIIFSSMGATICFNIIPDLIFSSIFIHLSQHLYLQNTQVVPLLALLHLTFSIIKHCWFYGCLVKFSFELERHILMTNDAGSISPFCSLNFIQGCLHCFSVLLFFVEKKKTYENKKLKLQLNLELLTTSGQKLNQLNLQSVLARVEN